MLFPGIAFGILTLWPWIERRFTKDRAEHHILDQPRDTPVRTGIGAAGLMVFFIMFLEGGNDIFGVLLNVSVETITRILQWGLVIAPIVTFLITYWICKGLSRTAARTWRSPASASAAPPTAATRRSAWSRWRPRRSWSRPGGGEPSGAPGALRRRRRRAGAGTSTGARLGTGPRCRPGRGRSGSPG